MEIYFLLCFQFIFAMFVVALGGYSFDDDENSGRVMIHGMIDGREYQNFDDTIPRDLEFSVNQELIYTCSHNFVMKAWTQWRHTVNNDKGVTLAAGPLNVPNNTVIKMRLFSFDNATTLICQAMVTATGERLTNMEVKLKLKSTIDETIEVEKVNLNENFDKIHKNCEFGSVNAVFPNKTIKLEQPKRFTITKEHDGVLVYCIKLRGEENNIYVRDITYARKLLVSDLQGSPSTQTASLPFKYIIMASVVISIISVSTVCYLMFRKKRLRQTHKSNESVYVVPHQVIYAELQLEDSQRRKNWKSDENVSPYAEIMGVLTPRT